MIRRAFGTVISLIAGFYDVQTNQGRIRTRARGNFRQKKQKPAVGDSVEIQIDGHSINYLIKILPRINKIGRPAVCNVSHILLVISAVQPDFSVQLLDRFLTFFAWQKVKVVIYLSKSDLVTDNVKLNRIRDVLTYYEKIGYLVFDNPTKLHQRIFDLIEKNKIWTLAGQSGAGKSTLLNFLKADAKQKTGQISTVLNHGKHTTRKVDLFNLGHGFLADTPGFSAIDLTPIKINELRNYFLDFKVASANCKFRGCQHIKEPGCAVKSLVQQKEIISNRYNDYLAIRTEIAAGRMPEYLK